MQSAVPGPGAGRSSPHSMAGPPRTWRPSFGGRLAVGFFSALNAVVPWHRLPKLIGAFNLHALRLSFAKRTSTIRRATASREAELRGSRRCTLSCFERQSVSSTICAVR